MSITTIPEIEAMDNLELDFAVRQHVVGRLRPSDLPHIGVGEATGVQPYHASMQLAWEIVHVITWETFYHNVVVKQWRERPRNRPDETYFLKDKWSCHFTADRQDKRFPSDGSAPADIIFEADSGPVAICRARWRRRWRCRKETISNYAPTNRSIPPHLPRPRLPRATQCRHTAWHRPRRHGAAAETPQGCRGNDGAVATGAAR